MVKKSKSVIVTVADDELNKINQLANRLGDEGMKVDRVMPVTGVIAGSCAASRVADLKKVDGVMSVEEEVVAQLPPQDSSVQ
jgi:homoaconitase/3-isopropylmalate dehydratase large subunit